ncbi:MAG: TetR family transcriptional regulator [Acetobacteraceae bacterium]|nr:TetR family transcriptional regulator [Acetobacteraceae bacterium]
MDDTQFDEALIAAAFGVAARRGWQYATVAEAARTAGLPLPRARRRFPGQGAILLRFGQAADAAALDGVSESGTVKDRLFDMLMRRIDVLQAHRAGVLALLRAVPTHPRTALLLALATRRSMQWLLDASGLEPGGVIGRLHRGGLEAVWLWTVRAWSRDESTDLGSTMAALDQALQYAADASRWLPSAPQRSAAPATPEAEVATSNVVVITEPDSGPADKVSDASGTPFPP